MSGRRRLPEFKDMVRSVTEESPLTVEAVFVGEESPLTVEAIVVHDVETQLNIASERGLNAVLKAMENHVNVVAVQENACGVLWSLGAKSNIRELIAQRGGIELVVKAMKKFPDSAGVQKQACHALRNFCMHSVQNQSAIAALDGIGTIFKALKYHKDDSAVCNYACGALLNISINHNENKLAILELGRVYVVIDAMRSFQDFDELQEHACGLLWSIMIFKDISQRSKEIILRNGGLDVIATVLNKHQRNLPALKMACGALRQLVNEKIESSVTSSVQMKIVSDVVAALHTYRNDERVQSDGFALLVWSLYGVCDECNDKVCVLQEVIERLLEDESAVANSLSLLCFYCSQEVDLNNISHLLNTVGTAMEIHMKSCVVQESAGKLLDVLIVQEGCCLEVSKAGIAEKMTVAMITYPDSDTLQISIGRSLLRVFRDSDMNIPNANEIVLSRLHGIAARKESAEVVYVTLQVLELVRNSFSEYSSLDECIPTILDCMHIHENNAGIQELACLSLAAFVPCSSQVPETISSVIFSAMKTHSSSIEVQINGCRALIAVIDKFPQQIETESQYAMLIRNTMSLHLSSGDFQDIACVLIKKLALISSVETNKTLTDCVISAMKAYRGTIKVQLSACYAFEVLVGYRDVSLIRHVIEQGGLGVLIHTMELYPDDANIQQTTCAAFKSMVCFDWR